MKILLLPLILVPVLVSCKTKKKKEKKNFVSVVSIIRKQVAKIDTSLYSIVKIVYTDSLPPDTSYIRRENFSEEARDFLETPDLSDSKVAERYREEPAVMDEMLNRVIITYTPLDPDNEEFKKQEILATPVPGEDALIKNIIIIREISNRDSLLQKQMLWQVDRSFQIVTVSQKPGKPVITITTKVSWNEEPEQ